MDTALAVPALVLPLVDPLDQKVFLVDQTCTTVGTANIDNRSFILNFELTLLNYEADFIRVVAAMLEDDFQHSRRMALEGRIQRTLLSVQTGRPVDPPPGIYSLKPHAVVRVP